MASMAMTAAAASFLGGSAISKVPTTATTRRGVVMAQASKGDEKIVMTANKEETSLHNGRRELVFAVAAAAACSVAKIAMAEGEPKPGSPEAKKKYAPICVTMPTARICRN